MHSAKYRRLRIKRLIKLYKVSLKWMIQCLWVWSWQNFYFVMVIVMLNDEKGKFKLMKVQKTTYLDKGQYYAFVPKQKRNTIHETRSSYLNPLLHRYAFLRLLQQTTFEDMWQRKKFSCRSNLFLCHYVFKKCSFLSAEIYQNVVCCQIAVWGKGLKLLYSPDLFFANMFDICKIHTTSYNQQRLMNYLR